MTDSNIIRLNPSLLQRAAAQQIPKDAIINNILVPVRCVRNSGQPRFSKETFLNA